jgi:hypothetical protein
MTVATLLIPLIISIYQTVGMAPLTLRVKAKAAAEGKEVCVIVDGPEYRKACRVLDGITWTQDFILRVPGEYSVFAISENYRTPELRVRVIGFEPEPE